MAPVSFPAAGADQSVSGRDDPEAVSGSGHSGTATADEDVAALDPVSDETVPHDTDSTGVSDSDPAPDPNAVPVPAAAEPAVPEPAARPVPMSLPDDVVELARVAAVEEAGSGGQVGDYLGAVQEDPVAVTASFAAADRGYRGWYWSVTLALVEPGYQTISEVVLLPGEQALLAPSWVPWDERIRKGDVGPGDLLPTAPDDPRLVPGYLDSDDPAVKEVSYEFGFGRVRVLSREGRDDAAERWHDGPFGPGDVVATQAQANCVTCGFFTPLAGLLGMAFGACTNEYSPADGRVVDAGYGCGAHSETVIDAPLISASTATVVDELKPSRRPAQMRLSRGRWTPWTKARAIPVPIIQSRATDRPRSVRHRGPASGGARRLGGVPGQVPGGRQRGRGAGRRRLRGPGVDRARLERRRRGP